MDSDSRADRKPSDTGVEVVVVRDAAAWRAWLDQNEDISDGIWLLLAKKGTTTPTSLTYAQALEEALCSGWIDGQSKSVDAATYRQRFTPRRRRSLWSARNVGKAGVLIDEGRMRPRGLAEIERAQADGRWDAAYAGAATIEVPDDLAAALDGTEGARTTFDALNAQNRYAVLHRVVTAQSPQTRRNRIDRLVAMLARGETPYPQ
ncbi:MAG: YdeI/OmpD-associated family protein [Gordonia amarae]